MSGLSANRITIQLDLSGYSFKLYDRSGNILSEDRRSCPVDLSVQELIPIIDNTHASVTVVFSTWKYTMVPMSYFDKSRVRETLSEVKDIETNEYVLYSEIPSQRGVMIYAVPSDVYEGLTSISKNIEFYPLSFIMIDSLASLEQNNRVIISFSEGMLHIAVSERDRLMFVNTFPARDMATVEYFIMSVVKDMTFNPEHTDIHIYGDVEDAVISELERFFPNVIKLK